MLLDSAHPQADSFPSQVRKTSASCTLGVGGLLPTTKPFWLPDPDMTDLGFHNHQMINLDISLRPEFAVPL